MKRNKFSLSHTKLLTCDMGYLIPVGCVETLPGDTIQQSTSCLVRFAPMLAPPMHPVHISLAHWFVPLRIIWNQFEDFITGGPAGTSVPVHPYRSAATITAGQLPDYLGLPLGTFAGASQVSALPYRAYQLIWNEWYRDQDLETEATVQVGSGADSTDNNLKRASWSKDYFTAARPWEQKGPTVTVPLGTVAPLKKKALGLKQTVRFTSDHTGTGSQAGLRVGADNALELDTSFTDVLIDVADTHETDLSTASAVTVNVLRQALALQRFEEARARYGSRYTEYLRYLGVRSSDARLQRPEFLGGGRYPVQFSEVLSTVETSGAGADPLGTLGGHGIGAARSNRYRRFFEEHGLIMSMMVVKPKAIYMQSVDKMFTRKTKEDYWQKELEHIGQQKVLNGEIYGLHSNPLGTFGYQDRYDEYRSQNSRIHGEFLTTLKHWHFGREFASPPALNASFVSCTPSEQPFAVPAGHNLHVMVKHSIQARRMVAKHGTSFIY